MIILQFTIYDLQHTSALIPLTSVLLSPLRGSCHTHVHQTGVYTPACDVVAPLGLRVYASYGDTHSPTSTQGVAHGLYMFKPFRLIGTVLKESFTLNS